MQAAFAQAADPRVTLIASPATVAEFLESGVDADVVLLDLRLADDSDPQANAEALRAHGCHVVVYSIADG